MDDTPVTTSGNDGLSYANAGGPRRARVPMSVRDLPGGFSIVNRSEVSASGASGTNNCPETSMARTGPIPDLFTGLLYFSNTTSLKA